MSAKIKSIARVILDYLNERGETEDFISRVLILLNNEHSKKIFDYLELDEIVVSTNLKVEKISEFTDNCKSIGEVLKTLAKFKKLSLMRNVLLSIININESDNGSVSVFVKSPVALTTDQVDQITTYIKNVCGLNAKVKVVIDASIEAGIKIEFQDNIVDLTMRRQLFLLEKSFC